MRHKQQTFLMLVLISLILISIDKYIKHRDPYLTGIKSHLNRKTKIGNLAEQISCDHNVSAGDVVMNYIALMEMHNAL